jgi:hypothetical protein
MIAPNYSRYCKEAEQYYYDFLSDEGRQSVPQEVINHIIGCSHCREQMSGLETVLTDVEKQSATAFSQRHTVTTAMLKLHFAYVGKDVTCATVKPFLPSLLDPALQIRIPTPITAHLDKCEQCKEDLERLQGLHLSPKQLRTLNQLFADDPVADETACAKAQAAIPSVVALVFDQLDAKTLRHLSLCPECREILYEFRERILHMTSRQVEDDTKHKQFPCSSITFSDVFDYCIPYNIDPASDEYAKFRKSLTSHIVCCADCLGKIQQLNRTIYGILDKPESGVVTAFHIDASVKTEPQAELDNLYAGFPVRVEVANLKAVQTGRERPRTEDLREPVKLKSVSKNLRPFLKVALPAAAVIVVAVGLLLNVPSAKALTINEIYTAIDKVKNIYIATFTPDKQEPVQQIWILRSSEIYATKTENELALWNISDGLKKTKHLDTDTMEQTSPSRDTLANVRNKLYGSLGIMPFSSSYDVPADAKWSEITDTDSRTIVDNTKVYELKWIEKTFRGLTSQRTWRVFADESTKLPRKIQWFTQSASDAQPVLELTMVIEYPNDQEIQGIMNDVSF